jgi:hypothetical protein
MSDSRVAYDDASSPDQMALDCAAVRAALRPAPSIRYEDYPREVTKPRIEIPAAAARLAAALHLQLDGE